VVHFSPPFLVPFYSAIHNINITVNYLPENHYLLAFLCGVIMFLILIIMVSAGIRIRNLLRVEDMVTDKWGDYVLVRVEDENPDNRE